jgi:hypothetical protein
MKKAISFFIIILLIVLAFLFLHKKKNFTKKLYFSTNDTNNTLIVIKNPSDKNVKFNFKLNGKFYLSINDFIKSHNNFADSEQLAIKLFNGFINSFVHEEIFDDWGEPPLTTLNSKGFAICGRQSEIFSTIAYNAGFQSRVIQLNGHVVSEIFYKGHWHLFDTDKKTYFTSQNKILSYEELVKNPHIIKKAGTKKYLANLTTMLDKYTKYLVTTSDNKFMVINNKNKDTFLLNIPPKSTFVFPFYPDYKKDFFPYNTKAKLLLPKGFNDKIKSPLILIDVEGEGIIKYKNKNYYIPKNLELLKAEIFSSNNFTNSINVEVLSDTLALVYMLNPLFSKIYKENELFINASDSLNIEISKNEFNSKSILYPIHIDLLNQYSKQAFDLVKEIDFKNINSINDLYEKQFKLYCLKKNLDTIKIKKRLNMMNKLITEPLPHFDNIAALLFTIILYSSDYEFKNFFLSTYKYRKYKTIIKSSKKHL